MADQNQPINNIFENSFDATPNPEIKIEIASDQKNDGEEYEDYL